MASNRFKKVTEEEVNEFKTAAENPNIRKSTFNWLRIFANWCEENGEDKYLENYLPFELDKLLQRFFASVCKQDGTNYEPGLLKVMQAALDRHFHEKGCSFSILKN